MSYYATRRSKRLTRDAALIVGDDGTGDLYTICEWALRDDPAATAQDVAEIVRQAIEDAEIEARRNT